MRLLLVSVLAAVGVGASKSSDDALCEASVENDGQRGGHRSMIHRHTLRGLSNEVDMPVQETPPVQPVQFASSEQELAALASKADCEKTSAEKAACEKAGANQTAAEKAACEKAADARAAAGKTGAEKAACEKEKAAAMKSGFRTAQELDAAEKVATEKVSAEKAAAEGAAAEKAAIEAAAKVGQTSWRKTWDAHGVVANASDHSMTDVELAFEELRYVLLASGYPAGGSQEHTRDDDPLLMAQFAKILENMQSKKVFTICETGFFAGHSALWFLATTNAKVYEFDLCTHSFSQSAAAFLYNKFPGRFNLTCGNSSETVPQFGALNPNVKCDFIAIDGARSREETTADLTNLGMISNQEAAVYLDGTPCTAEQCAGPSAAWDRFVEDNCIWADSRVNLRPDFGYSYGTIQGCVNLQVGP